MKTKRRWENKRYCCVPDMVLTISDSKDVAMDICSRIYDKRHKKIKTEKRVQMLFDKKPLSFKQFCKKELDITIK